MKTSKTVLAATCGMLLAGATTAAQAFIAQDILFDPDGAGTTFAPQLIDSLDWDVGNAVAIEGNLAGQADGSSFNLVTLAHANLANLKLNNAPVNPTGFVPPNISFVASIPETTKVVTQNIVTFSTWAGAPASVNFFEIYASGTAGNNLTGTGFNDGELILRAAVYQVGGGFIGDDPQPDPLPPMDSFGTNNYPGTFSIAGSGSPTLYASVAVGWFDPDYFPGGIETLNIFFDTSLVVPFLTVDPSQVFANTKNETIGSAGVAPTYSPVVGVINGGPTLTGSLCVNGALRCDFRFSADPNSSFEATRRVPEPGTLALLGLGLGLAGFSRRLARRT